MNQGQKKVGWILLDFLLPLLLYYLASNVVYYFLDMSVARFAAENGPESFWAMHAVQISVVDNAIAMIVGVWFLRRQLLQEGLQGGQPVLVRPGNMLSNWIKEGFKQIPKKWKEVLITIAICVVTSVAFNMLANLIQVQSLDEKYQNISAKQYSVPLVVGIIIYGLVSPIVEEIVFRGVFYKKCRRYFGMLPAMLLSSFIFGVFHGNVVQAVYAFLMGMVISFLYEKYRNFFIPIFAHASANLVIFIWTYVGF